MRFSPRWLLVAFVLSILLAPLAQAIRFDPAFRVTNLKGTASVMPPGMTAFVAAEEGKAYPFGTYLQTGPDSTLRINFYQDHYCTVGPNARVQVFERPDHVVKTVGVYMGKVEVTLDEGYQAENQLDVSFRCATITFLSGGNASIDVQGEDDLKAAVVTCARGQLKITGPYYEVPSIGENQSISIACSTDKGFSRIRVLNGQIPVQVLDEAGGPRTIELAQNFVLKVLQKRSETETVALVSYLEVNPGGEITQAKTLNAEYRPDTNLDDAREPTAAPAAPEGGEAAPPAEPAVAEPEAGAPPAPEAEAEKKTEEPADGEWPDWPVITTTTTSTTTTTIPPIDLFRPPPTVPPTVAPTTTTTTRPRPTTTTTKPDVTPKGRF